MVPPMTTATPAVQQALKSARAEASRKQVWLVYQLNDDDSTIGTIWSNASAEGEVYGYFQQAITAYMKPALDARLQKLEAAFASKEELLDATAAQALDSLDVERDAKEIKKIQDKLAQAKFRLSKDKRTATMNLPKSQSAAGIKSAPEMGAQAAYIRDYIRDCCGDFDADGARHAEENFIRRFPSLVGTLGSTPLDTVRLYMNFSPCLNQSLARDIGDIAYLAGCMNKLKQLANAYNGVQWHIHYDQYFTAPDLDSNTQACKRAHFDQPNVRMYKLTS